MIAAKCNLWLTLLHNEYYISIETGRFGEIEKYKTNGKTELHAWGLVVQFCITQLLKVSAGLWKWIGFHILCNIDTYSASIFISNFGSLYFHFIFE